MTSDLLQRSGLIEPCRVRQAEIRDLLEVSRRDVRTARELKNIDLDWSLAVAYNAALQAALALMYAKGFRPKGPDRHKTVIRFLRSSLDKSLERMLNRLDRIRKRRHRAVYRTAGAISDSEASNSIRFAEEFVKLIANLIQSE